MNDETITIVSMVDGKLCKFPVQPTSKNQFKRGKCWNAMCDNPIWFVHLTVHGTADFGRCYACAELMALEYFVKQLKQRGKWVMPENGKPVEWRFDEKTLSFSPLTARQAKEGEK